MELYVWGCFVQDESPHHSQNPCHIFLSTWGKFSRLTLSGGCPVKELISLVDILLLVVVVTPPWKGINSRSRSSQTIGPLAGGDEGTLRTWLTLPSRFSQGCVPRGPDGLP